MTTLKIAALLLLFAALAVGALYAWWPRPGRRRR